MARQLAFSPTISTISKVADRFKAITVILDRDMDESQVEAMRLAIEQLKGVAATDLGAVTYEDVLARHRVKAEVRAKLFDAIGEILDAESS